jgi:hypothetical protein
MTFQGQCGEDTIRAYLRMVLDHGPEQEAKDEEIKCKKEK